MSKAKSFKLARMNFAANLLRLLKQFNYTPASFALKFNTYVDRDELSTSRVYDWLKNAAIPSVYELYKLSDFFRVSIDNLFDSNFNINTALGHSFALQTTESITDTALVTNVHSKENTLMATQTASNTVSISRKAKKEMETVVYARTTSRNANLLLANKIYSNPSMLKDIATKLGCSTRSLRDYCFYATSVPQPIADKIVKMFKTSPRNLGLTLNKETNRYEHMSVRIKA